MVKKLMMTTAALLVLGCAAWGAEKSFRGVISDSMCGAKHATASDDAAACVAKCVKGGSKYVLVSHGKVYQLDPQDKVSADLAGRNAKVTGTLNGETITVSSVTAAPAAKKKAKKKAST
jgi:hypothetical protein